jgi:hypothetical protein
MMGFVRLKEFTFRLAKTVRGASQTGRLRPDRARAAIVSGDDLDFKIALLPLHTLAEGGSQRNGEGLSVVGFSPKPRCVCARGLGRR